MFSLASLHADETCSEYLVASENVNLGSYTSRTLRHNEQPEHQQQQQQQQHAIVEDSDVTKRHTNCGAVFVVFNGALKTNLVMNAKVSAIEDGLMVQIDAETLLKLKQALQAMKPFTINCTKALVSSPSTPTSTTTTSTASPPTPNPSGGGVIHVEWTRDDRHVNAGVRSVIDGRSLSGVKSLRLLHGAEWRDADADSGDEANTMRWTEIFLIKLNDNIDENSFNLNKFAEMCAEVRFIYL